MSICYKAEPKWVTDDFYAVEETGNLPVSKKGEVIFEDMVTFGKIVAGYYAVYHLKKTIFIHRALALTFLDCPGNPKDYQVNHKDGDKLNNHLENLEWCTVSENAIHAYRTGLREDSIPIDCKNLKTGKIFSFYSFAEAGRFFNIHSGLILNYLRGKRNQPWRKKWTFKYASEEKWPKIEKKKIGVSGNGYPLDVIAISDTDDKKIIFNGVGAAARWLGVKHTTLGWYIQGLRENGHLYKGFRWYYLDFYRKTVNTETDKIEKKGQLGNSFRQHTKRLPKRVRETDLTSGKEKIWLNLKEVAESLGVKKNTLEKRIWKNNGYVDNKFYEYLNHI